MAEDNIKGETCSTYSFDRTSDSDYKTPRQERHLYRIRGKGFYFVIKLFGLFYEKYFSLIV